MEEKDGLKVVPFIAHEADMARMERTNVRLTVTAVIELAVLLASNLYWIIRLF